MRRKKYLKEQARFRKDARAMIEEAGAVLFSEGAPSAPPGAITSKWTVHVLPCPRINAELAISIWCDEYDLYSIYMRTNDGEQSKRVAAAIEPVWSDPMNPFSGKWNIHEHTPEAALMELERRLHWLTTIEMQPA